MRGPNTKSWRLIACAALRKHAQCAYMVTTLHKLAEKFTQTCLLYMVQYIYRDI